MHIPKTAGRSIEDIFKRMNTGGFNRIERHLSLNKIYAKFPDTIDYFSFTVVRNPWARMVSLYLYIWKQAFKQEKTNDLKFASLGFSQFLRSNYFESQQGWSNPFYTNQIDWIANDDKNCDYILKFENLQKDWKHIATKFQIKKKLPYSNTSVKGIDYKIFYNTEDKNLINKRFEQDIDTFKYTF